MKKIKYYSHEIYSVITMLLITLSAIFVKPDTTQKIILLYAFIFLLHEWEENNYPGGFFDVMFGEVMNIKPVPSGKKLREARIYVYILLITLTFVPYFFHNHLWFILPIVYLGLIEGTAHTMSIIAFKLDRKYTPGMATALVQFILSVCTLYYLISNSLINLWQYLAAIPLLILGLFFMAFNGMKENNINIKTVPEMVKKNFKSRRNSH